MLAPGPGALVAPASSLAGAAGAQSLGVGVLRMIEHPSGGAAFEPATPWPPVTSRGFAGRRPVSITGQPLDGRGGAGTPDRLDILILNAAAQAMNPIASYAEADWDR